MRSKTKIVLVLLLFVPLFSFAFAPRAAASHGELNSFIRIPSFGVNFPSNWHSAPWQTMIDSWDPATSHLIMYWWCEPFDDEWVWVGPGPDEIPGTEDDIWFYDWNPDMPSYNGDEGIVIGFGMGIFYDEEYQELNQESAKRFREETECRVIIDAGTPDAYEVDLRISPVVYNPQVTNPFVEGWRVYFYRVGAVFKPGELREIIGSGEHTMLLMINDWEFGAWNSDIDISWAKFFGDLPPAAPDTCWFELT
ncbi:MAG: hypothetical protein ACFFAL_00965 [Promethearchaeota archaeon]